MIFVACGECQTWKDCFLVSLFHFFPCIILYPIVTLGSLQLQSKCAIGCHVWHITCTQNLRFRFQVKHKDGIHAGASEKIVPACPPIFSNPASYMSMRAWTRSGDTRKPWRFIRRSWRRRDRFWGPGIPTHSQHRTMWHPDWARLGDTRKPWRFIRRSWRRRGRFWGPDIPTHSQHRTMWHPDWARLGDTRKPWRFIRRSWRPGGRFWGPDIPERSQHRTTWHGAWLRLGDTRKPWRFVRRSWRVGGRFWGPDIPTHS